MPLNDDEVQQEMKKMVSFIKQEAIEKARELQVKADEEFNIEKAKIVRQETLAIESNYGRKLKQAEISRKIAQSSLLNKMRLEVLQVRDQCLNELFEEAKARLVDISKNQEGYKRLMRDLVVQCLFDLLEPNVSVQCRECDVPLLKSLLDEASQIYCKTTGKTVCIQIDAVEFLPSHSSGGVVVSCQEGKIKCVNTLEARLDLLCVKMLPEMRIALLGPSKTRKFFD